MDNIFNQPENLRKIQFDTYYKCISNIEAILPEDVLCVTSTAKKTDSLVNSVESLPNDIWEIEIFLGDVHNDDEIIQLLQSASEMQEEIEILTDLIIISIKPCDWEKNYQDNLKPIIIDQFFITNSKHIHSCPKNLIPICLQASSAFGSGEHETTSGCALMMRAISDRENDNIFDIGTGSGILSFIAEKIWPQSSVIACDIDQVAINCSNLSAKYNQSKVHFFKNDEKIILPAGKPLHYDLVISNILAAPLIIYAPFYRSLCHKDSMVILSGFLKNQLEEVKVAYENVGFKLINKIEKNNWITALFSVKYD